MQTLTSHLNIDWYDSLCVLRNCINYFLCYDNDTVDILLTGNFYASEEIVNKTFLTRF
jgi:hypothetical protein